MKVTMSHTPRQLTNKPRAKNEAFDFLKPSTIPKLAKPIIPRAAAPFNNNNNNNKAPKPLRPPADNKLLAGYLAHEFLTKGTLFGQQWDPARADVVPVSAAAHSGDFRKTVRQNVGQKGKLAEPKPGDKRKLENYNEVSGLLVGKNGIHIPGIVNPTQLTRFLHQ